jgi:ABC-type Mn2+/Zn2+ transport system ATPase subunit
MPRITEREIVGYIEQHIELFHSFPLEVLTKLKLQNVARIRSCFAANQTLVL